VRSRSFKFGVAAFLVFLIGAYAFFFLRNINRAVFADGVLTAKGVRYEMAAVPGGKFAAGAETGPAREQPERLSGFWLGKSEVSNALWRAVLGDNSPRLRGENDAPVQDVSRNDCRLFIDKLNEMSGAKFRLPTERERQYARRLGIAANGSTRGLRLAADLAFGNRR
jgi:formylglycine-generating enzyme required for sulfatase activity